MDWPTWDQAAAATLVLACIAFVAGRSEAGRAATVAAAARETALVSFLYTVWRLARQLPLTREAGAYERGRQIHDLQRTLRLPDEADIVDLVLRHRWLAELSVDYYAIAHVPTLLAFLVWLWVRHRDSYPHWRNALAMTTGACLFIRFVRVAPPRLLPEYGFVDVPAALGRSIYGPVTANGASDQFAAMPSIHVAWAAVVGFGMWAVGNGRWWRWLGPLHLALTTWAVVATANHWWMDGIVAVGLLWLSLVIDEAIRRRR